MAPRVSLLLPGLLLTGCTPLGGWVYSDPSFQLREVTRPGASASDTLQLVLLGCNLNDFELYALSVEGTLTLHGAVVGTARSNGSLVLPLRDSARIPLPFVLVTPPSGAGDRPVRYHLTGHSMVRTPLGDRRVPIRQEGTVRWRSAGPDEWTTRDPRACRPGQSHAPHSAQPKQMVRPEDLRQERDRPVVWPESERPNRGLAPAGSPRSGGRPELVPASRPPSPPTPPAPRSTKPNL